MEKNAGVSLEMIAREVSFNVIFYSYGSQF